MDHCCIACISVDSIDDARSVPSIHAKDDLLGHDQPGLRSVWLPEIIPPASQSVSWGRSIDAILHNVQTPLSPPALFRCLCFDIILVTRYVDKSKHPCDEPSIAL